MTNAERIAQHQVNLDEWSPENMNYVNGKIQLETIEALFIALVNTIAGQIDPELLDKIDGLRDEIIEYLQPVNESA